VGLAGAARPAGGVFRTGHAPRSRGWPPSAARLGTAMVDLVSAGGVVLARHRRHPDGAGAVVRLDEHVAALERTVLAAFTDRAPCKAKMRRPPSPAAHTEAAQLRDQVGGTGATSTGTDTGSPRSGRAAAEQVVVNFSHYAAAAASRQGTPVTVGS
jgi:hypothetical protein